MFRLTMDGVPKALKFKKRKNKPQRTNRNKFQTNLRNKSRSKKSKKKNLFPQKQRIPLLKVRLLFQLLVNQRLLLKKSKKIKLPLSTMSLLKKNSKQNTKENNPAFSFSTTKALLPKIR